MARISDEDIERVRAATDLVSLISERISLKQRGRLFWGCCPFHNEKTPSFKVDPDTQLWHCFGCGKGGNVFGFIMEADNMEFPDAVRMLADRAHIEIAEEGGQHLPQGYKERLKAIMATSAGFYHFALMRNKGEEASQARAYLSARGFGSEVCKRWNLGFSPGHGALVRHLTKKGFTRQEIIDSNMAMEFRSGQRAGQVSDRFYDRIMFPINDRDGTTIAFGGRVIGPTPPNTGKYINTADTPIFNKRRNMFAFDRARAQITATGTAVVVEGYTDVMALHEAGLTNVVATLGTSLTPEHLRLLRTARPKRIVYLFDGDDAGQKAADRAAQFIDYSATEEAGRDFVELLVAVIPGNADPAEYVASAGAEQMRAVIAGASPLIRFAIDRRLEKWDLTSPEQRTPALADVAKLLAPIKGTLMSDDYANYVADFMGARIETVQHVFSQAKPAPRVRTEDAVDAPSASQSRMAVPRADTTKGGAQGSAVAPSAAKSGQASEAEQVERELLCLIAKHPTLAPHLGKGIEKINWTSPAVKAIATALAHVPDKMKPAAVIASVDADAPGAASYLAAGTLDAESMGGPEAAARQLYIRLCELDLMERIRSGNAQLKKAAAAGQNVDNELFANVAKLQQELTNLRKASS